MFSGKYDRDCLQFLQTVAEIAGDIIGTLALCASIVGAWFIGCALV